MNTGSASPAPDRAVDGPRRSITVPVAPERISKLPLNFPRVGQGGEREARKAGNANSIRIALARSASEWPADSSTSKSAAPIVRPQQDFAMADTAMSSSDSVLDDIHALLYNVLYKSE
ncbi:hypothetical protein [Rhizobium giardinii]|uniref:Uncharacterized protein n=1 Tax=Rhizobium giardinii TaxID=56731 RepID=A0A7W8UDB3_9HYPH|nr:hypothetical protein [Rhizobium giardinii]MBB5537277.1 hypothetical protein [Rhizobium giardinii]